MFAAIVVVAVCAGRVLVTVAVAVVVIVFAAIVVVAVVVVKLVDVTVVLTVVVMVAGTIGSGSISPPKATRTACTSKCSYDPTSMSFSKVS